MKKAYTGVTVILVIIIAVSVIVDLNAAVSGYLSRTTLENLEADVITNVTQINTLIDTQYKMLEYVANTDAVRDKNESEIDFGTNIPGFLNMSVYRADGNGYSNKKFLGNFKEHEFFEKGMKGQKSLYVDNYTGSGKFVFNVPIKDDYGNTKAVLSGVCSTMMFCDHLMVNHGSNQRVFIYDNIGRVVFKDPSVKETGLEKMSGSYKNSVGIFNDIKEGKNGSYSVDYGSERFKVVYNKLSVNNWYIIAVDSVDDSMADVFSVLGIGIIIKTLLMFMIIILYFVYSRHIYKERISRVREETSMLTKTIPGSTVMCKLDELLTIKYASEAMYTKLGYTSTIENPVSTLGLREIIHPDDLKGFNKLFNEFKNTNSKFEYKCRFICKNGKPRWMSCYARFVNNINNIKNLYLVAIDISEQKETERRLQISEERYKVVIQQSNSIVFEYNIKNHDYFVTNNFYEIFSVSANSGDIFAVFMKQRRIHSDDKYKFEQMISDVYSKCGFRDEELRIMDATKKYAWYSLKITSISDTGSAPARIIGNLSNIDAQKKNIIDLANQAQYDQLTGCLNREAALSMTRKLIENETEDALSAMIIVDIDHFRQINDKFGIDVGDELLKKVSRMLKNLVRSSDIVGRIGDDEFMVFLRGCTAMSQITNKVQSFIDGAHNIKAGVYSDTTFSIGVSLYPSHSKDYDELYDKADKAVYISKITGYDKYTIYDANNM